MCRYVGVEAAACCREGNVVSSDGLAEHAGKLLKTHEWVLGDCPGCADTGVLHSLCGMTASRRAGWPPSCLMTCSRLVWLAAFGADLVMQPPVVRGQSRVETGRAVASRAAPVRGQGRYCRRQCGQLDGGAAGPHLDGCRFFVVAWLLASPNAGGRAWQAACCMFQEALVGYEARREVVDRRRNRAAKPGS